MRRKRMGPLRGVRGFYNDLIEDPSKVKIDKMKAAEIYNFLQKCQIDFNRLDSIQYLAFLQAYLAAAIEASGSMWFVKELFDHAMKPTATAKDIIKDVAKDFLKRYCHIQIKGEAPPIYENVVTGICYNCSSYFDEIRNAVPLDL